MGPSRALRRRKERGGALLLALALAAGLALIAEAVLRVTMSRTLAFTRQREEAQGRLAAQAFFNHLSGCLNMTRAQAEQALCPTADGWFDGGNPQPTTRDYTLSGKTYRAAASFASGSLSVEAAPLPP